MENDRIDYEPGVLRVFQTRSETRAFYNKIAKVYDILSEHSERPMREAGIRMLAPALGERLLEIGFGTGHVLVELARAVGPTGKVFGIDISENMLAESQAVVEREKVADRVSLVCGDAEACPTSRIPWMASSCALHSNCSTRRTFHSSLPNVHERLRPGGRIVVVAVSKTGPQGLVIRAFEWTHRHFPNLMDCRPIYTRRALEAAGFVIEDSSNQTMWVPVEIVRAGKPGQCSARS